MLHRDQRNKTMERLETSILHEQQKRSFVQRDLDTVARALKRYKKSLCELKFTNKLHGNSSPR
jgi:hypothetical protein